MYLQVSHSLLCDSLLYFDNMKRILTSAFACHFYSILYIYILYALTTTLLQPLPLVGQMLWMLYTQQ